MPYVRTVKTASGATAVQIVYCSRRGSRDIEHIGSAHDDAELELLTAAARQRLAAGQGELDLGLDASPAGGPLLSITASRMGCLLDALTHAYDVLGLGAAAGGDEVFRDLVLARIIEPASKLDSLRVLEERASPPRPTGSCCGGCPAMQAHLTIIFAALPISRWIEHQTGWSIRRFVKTARRYRTIKIQAGTHTITAADPLPPDLRAALDEIHGRSAAHSIVTSQV